MQRVGLLAVEPVVAAVDKVARDTAQKQIALAGNSAAKFTVELAGRCLESVLGGSWR
ncbi:MAG TPA: hypothetical protein VK192_09985 [Sphingomicrobium sp.]|nr:hypothetical protein [Sphingomicrobium sp.]